MANAASCIITKIFFERSQFFMECVEVIKMLYPLQYYNLQRKKSTDLTISQVVVILHRFVVLIIVAPQDTPDVVKSEPGSWLAPNKDIIIASA